ncbi:MAG: hypothetical protein JXM73_01285, partial [Anaerolineae bacterium]|nr:hypothetical protein [Anaerolineae bacterium]
MGHQIPVQRGLTHGIGLEHKGPAEWIAVLHPVADKVPTRQQGGQAKDDQPRDQQATYRGSAGVGDQGGQADYRQQGDQIGFAQQAEAQQHAQDNAPEKHRHLAPEKHRHLAPEKHRHLAPEK